jgi:tetratricopeptide (TPR) repeat protein
MKISVGLAVLLLFPLGALRASTLPPRLPSPATQVADGAPATPASSGDVNQIAEAYYDFTLGHYYQQRYEASRDSGDAELAIDSFKKAYALDPSSATIRQQLAEVYFQSQRIRDAVLEAQGILAKDPNNLPARRLLAHIYVRTLGELNENSAQRDTVARAVDQYREILRLDPTDIDAALWLARLYRLQNDQEKAEAVLRGLLARDPENENAVEQLSQLLLDQGKTQEAISSLKDVLGRAPTPRLWDQLGDADMQVRDFPGAEQAYRQATDDDPNGIDHRRGLAQALLNEEKYPQALEQYQRLAAIEQDNPENYLREAEIYRQMGQLDKAEENILLAKQRAPGNLEVIYYESSIYEDQGRFDDAIRVLSDAVTSVKAQSEFTPSRRRTLAILYQQLGHLYTEVDKYGAAVNTFEEMQRLGPEEDRRARALIIDAYRQARDLPKALEASQKALEAHPKDRELLITQALLYGENVQTDLAATQLRGLLNGTGADFEIQLDLAQVYQHGQRWPEAEQAIQTAEKIAQQPSEVETVHFVLGAIYERQKKYDQAEAQFREVLKQNPRYAPALNYLGYMLADRGIRLDEALSLINRALAEDPSNPAYQDSLGWVYFKQDKFPEAEEMLRKAISRDAHDPTILSHLGDVYAKTGQDSLAEAQWQKSIEEWSRVLPGNLEPDKVAEIQKKMAALKKRLAQEKSNHNARPE